ncbi:MAG: hypothetical protein ABJX32_09795 [Tateyamaria sp.]|uniref:hypothetical protein n=1 Tax=Tateyamaria sp. TaxID=1929288 RepID=UPI00329B1BCF
MSKSLALAALLAVLTPLNVNAFGIATLETFTIPIVPLDKTTFEAIEADGAGGTQMWCAAGIFATRVLGITNGEIYIKQARGPSVAAQGRKGVVFTTQEVPNASKSYSQGVQTTGKSFSAGHAHSLCFGSDFRVVRIRLPNGQIVRR